jgi:hypothetical protein
LSPIAFALGFPTPGQVFPDVRSLLESEGHLQHDPFRRGAVAATTKAAGKGFPELRKELRIPASKSSGSSTLMRPKNCS